MDEEALRQHCTYLPWIGSDFADGGLLECSVLLLGESHYTDKGNTNPDLTRNVVERLALKSSKSYFTKTMRTVLRREEESADETQRFWNSVAFYNYIQSPVGTDAREEDPTPEQWRNAESPFQTVVEELTPDAIVVLGKRLWRHLPEPEETKLLNHRGQEVQTHIFGQGALAASVAHPSSGSLEYSTACPIVDSLLTAAGSTG